MSDISSILIDNNTGLVSFGWPKSGPIKLEGIFSLVQLAVFTILRTAGMDSFRDDYGTTFWSMVGKSVANDFPNLKADISIIIKTAEKEILTEQKAYNNLRADDTLTSLTLLRVDQDVSDITRFNIYVNLSNAAGNALTFGIPTVRS